MVNLVHRYSVKCLERGALFHDNFDYASVEATRTLRILQAIPSKNKQMRDLYLSNLKQALLNID